MNPKDFDAQTLFSLLQKGCTITFPEANNPYMRPDLDDGYLDIGNEQGGLGRYSLDVGGVKNALQDADLFPVPEWDVHLVAVVKLDHIDADTEIDVALDWDVMDREDDPKTGTTLLFVETDIRVSTYGQKEALDTAIKQPPSLFNDEARASLSIKSIDYRPDDDCCVLVED